MTHSEMITSALQRVHCGDWLPQEQQARRENLRKDDFLSPLRIHRFALVVLTKCEEFMSELTIEHWDDLHPRWRDLVQIVADEQQEECFSAKYEWHRSSHVLVALQDKVICGFLRFTTQVIGDDADCDPVMLNGILLIEAKVLAFAVVARFRNQGIGRALQTDALHYAVKLRCYQLRSHSRGKNEANHHLKLSMGFGIYPILRDGDKRGAYFVMPLFHLWDISQKGAILPDS